MGQGRDNAKKFLLENKDVCLEIENKIRELHGMAPIAEAAAVGDASGAVDIPQELPPADDVEIAEPMDE
jgi:recombination protein RecA